MLGGGGDLLGIPRGLAGLLVLLPVFALALVVAVKGLLALGAAQAQETSLSQNWQRGPSFLAGPSSLFSWKASGFLGERAAGLPVSFASFIAAIASTKISSESMPF